VPTKDDWDKADTFGAWDNNTEAYNSALKLPSSGYRGNAFGTLNDQGTVGYYWCSTVTNTTANGLSFSSTEASTSGSSYRVYGFTVRCLKD
jgi:hypothetical protein